ncbi:MAG: DoxX family protein [Bacteroidota bacterium]
MKTIFNPGSYQKNISLALLLIRLAAGAFMLTHGWSKLEKAFGTEPIQFSDPLGIGVTASWALTVFAEFFCSFLLLIGLTTRLATIPLMITMIVAAFIVHGDDPFGKKELALFYLLVYIALAIAGAGRYSADNWVFNRLNQRRKR